MIDLNILRPCAYETADLWLKNKATLVMKGVVGDIIQ